MQLMLTIGIVGSNSLALSPIASTVATSFIDVFATDVMLASALFGLGTATGALTLAPRADNIGLLVALRYSLMFLLIGFMLSALAPTLWALCLGQAIAGIASGVALPCIYGLAAEIAPEGKENETLGKVLLGWTLSMVIGVTVAAHIAEWLHWRSVYILLIIAATFVLIQISKSNNQLSRVSPTALQNKESNSHSPWVALAIPKVIPSLLSVAAFMIAFYGVYGFLGTHLTIQLGASTVTGGLASLIYGLGFGVVSPLDKWMDKYGAKNSAACVFSMLFFIYIGIGVTAGSKYTILCLCFIWGALNHLALNLLVAKLSAISPPQRAAIMGLYSAVTYLSMFFGTLAFKSLYELFGFSISGFAAALLIVPLAITALNTVYRYHRHSIPK